MKHLIALSIYVSALALFTACSPESVTVTSKQPEVPAEVPVIPEPEVIPPQKFEWVTVDGGQSQLDFNPQVDILFVIDNSDSMKSAQENLSSNIEKFATGITRNKMIDYHIGVISTWDQSERFAKNKKDAYQIGDLRHIRNLKKQASSQRFVTKQNRAQGASLPDSISIGVAPYAQGGPEVEEFFSPLNAALEKTGHGAANEGFFRPEAQLVVIIMTDADDSTSRISPEQMAQTLIDFKGGNSDKLSVYGVLVRAQDNDKVKDWDLRVHPKYHPECFDVVNKKHKNNGRCADGFGPDRLEQLIVAANVKSGTPEQIRKNFIMPITSKKFGTDLVKIGSDITLKTLAKEILLQQRPRYDEGSKQWMVRVRYGQPKDLSVGKGQKIPQKQIGGWLYDPANNSVLLSGDIQYEYSEGARFAVDMIPIPLVH